MMIGNQSDIALFLNEYGKDNITFLYDVNNNRFTISEKAEKFFGKTELLVEELDSVIEMSELKSIKNRIQEMISSGKDNKTSISCRVKGINGAFLCTLDIKINNIKLMRKKT